MHFAIKEKVTEINCSNCLAIWIVFFLHMSLCSKLFLTSPVFGGHYLYDLRFVVKSTDVSDRQVND